MMAFLENLVVTLTPTIPVLSTWYQRYVQSEEGTYDITDRANVAGARSECINVRFFDPDNVQRPLYAQPTECNPIATPIGNTDSEIKAAYDRGDFSIAIDGYDVVSDLGFEITGFFDDNGDAIDFTDFVPGKVYVHPEVGMFAFFHYPDKWDTCSYWDLAWWNSGGLSEGELNEPPYTAEWDDETTLLTVPPAENQSWDDLLNPLPLNTYWDVVSEAPTEESTVVVCYWTQDSADPIPYSVKSRRYTSPITLITDTQLRFRSVDLEGDVEATQTETYEVGLRLSLDRGINLVSQPRALTGVEANADTLTTGLDLKQIFRIENGLWQVYSPGAGDLNDPTKNSLGFNTIDNQHGYFVVMNGPGTWCISYGTSPDSTELALVDEQTNQGINAIGVPRSSTANNSIANLLIDRNIDFNELYRVTNGVFETYIVGRADVLNFSPTDLTPGRGYGIKTDTATTFELPFTD